MPEIITNSFVGHDWASDYVHCIFHFLLVWQKRIGEVNNVKKSFNLYINYCLRLYLYKTRRQKIQENAIRPRYFTAHTKPLPGLSCRQTPGFQRWLSSLLPGRTEIPPCLTPNRKQTPKACMSLPPSQIHSKWLPLLKWLWKETEW